MKPQVTPEKIYKVALSLLGTDASPADAAPDELGCAETVSDILFEAGCIIPITVSTAQLDHFLKTSKDWQPVADPGPGDVLVSPTGQGGEGGISHGHTGIVMLSGKIASNDSATGNFLENYTLTSWKNRYANRGGYPMNFYRVAVVPTRVEPQVPEAVAKTVSDGLLLATEAAKHPELKMASLGLLGALAAFLKKFF